jgi:phage terminase large subunit-like protein
MSPDSLAAELLNLDRPERLAAIARMNKDQQISLQPYWRLWAHDGQLPPEGEWHTWLIMAGRGYGKTRAGAEWVRAIAEADPAARIALVGATLGEARRVMVEGPSGLLAIASPKLRPDYEPSKRELTWPKGAVATLYSAGEPDSLRGPQHSHAWCDEVAKWDQSGGRAQSAWDNLLLGLRLGRAPRAVATTTSCLPNPK